jgi:hypothetical protein
VKRKINIVLELDEGWVPGIADVWKGRTPYEVFMWLHSMVYYTRTIKVESVELIPEEVVHNEPR